MVPGCPQAFVRPILAALRLADLFDKGLPPVTGGVLDQANWFVEFYTALQNEDSRARYDAD